MSWLSETVVEAHASRSREGGPDSFQWRGVRLINTSLRRRGNGWGTSTRENNLKNYAFLLSYLSSVGWRLRQTICLPHYTIHERISLPRSIAVSIRNVAVL